MASKGRTVLSVIFLAAGLVLLVPGILFWIMSAGSSSDPAYKEPYCVVELEDITELGGSYEGVSAEEGYTFYEFSYLVKNLGDGESYQELPSLYYEGPEYNDVYEHYYWDSQITPEEETEAPLFDGYYDLCIPPGRVGRASEVLMVKDGVTAVQASYYPGYSDEKLILDIDLS